MFQYPKVYDVIVIGAGHAGVEAALAAARMGCETLLLTMNLDTIGQMSCNPAIGGLAKGQIVREIDALGGEMGLNTDATGVQFRMLNASKGPSVRGPRAQCDKKAYQFRLKATCERQERLDVKQGHIAEILVDGERVTGVSTQLGVAYRSRSVIVTTGTFLQGLMHVGLRNTPGGRMGDTASGLSASLLKLGFELKRLKTGTPPRLLKKSIDFSQMDLQHGDTPPKPFSYMAHTLKKGRDDIFTLNEWRDGMFHVEQLACAITYTTAQTHEIVRSNLDQSPLYCGRIEGVGPRYCPSLEDKVVRFADKERHQLFLEPEGRHTDEYYINGCSTSLPFEVQLAFIRSIPGLEKAEIMRAGYAVEYDFSPPTQLQPSLETKRIAGLFFAGQLNGTSGYEEAAGQGLLAGINAARLVKGEGPLILGRDQAYIGVLIDDLVTKGTEEPYRMFTSRAEHRLLLRHDNADLRLTEIGADIGLASPERTEKLRAKRESLAATRHLLETIKHDNQPWAHLLKRPDTTWTDLPAPFAAVDPEVASQLETEIKYEGYLKREQAHIERNRADENRSIPDWLDFDAVPGLKAEARVKLKKIQPRTFGQASRISGINPTDVALLQIHTKRGKVQFFSVETSIQATDTFSNDEIRRSILFSSVYLVILGIFQLWVYYDARFYRYSLFRGRARKSITKNADEKTRPWDELEKEAQWVVDEVMAKFPPDVLAEAEKVPLVFEERSQRKTMDGRKIMGIYVGFIEGHVSEGKGPIILYLRSIEEYCAWSGKTFQDEVRTTYLHELGHHFGWNEKDVEKRDL